MEFPLQKKDFCSANKRRTEDPLARGKLLKQHGFQGAGE
ncbi:hypothetical protein BN134_732 [Cronobacter dublinensis 1210]|uniref:Uncharacterized protein n=1 Tax=Cronobacter dublinensis 1210 TaxID=1208656 RepID=A0ABP1W4K3_9ENTR|nr:hypothetical protein BN134_732 [Cronobacter dublinensis 1210]